MMNVFCLAGAMGVHASPVTELSLLAYGIEKFSNPYLNFDKKKHLEKSGFQTIGFSGETIFLFFVLVNEGKSDLDRVTAEIRRIDGDKKKESYTDIFLIRTWYQVGLPIITKNENKIDEYYVPELLLKNDVSSLEPGQWINGRYIPPNIKNDLLTTIPAGDFRYFCFKAVLPEVDRFAEISWHLVIKQKDTVLLKLPVLAKIFPRQLPVSKKIKSLYFFGSLDDQDPNNYTVEALKGQLADISAHGFNGITIKGHDRINLRRIAELGKESGVGDNAVIIFTGSEDNNLKKIYNTVKEVIPSTFVMTVNEPNNERKLKKHLDKWTRWKQYNFSVYAPIKVDWDRKLWNRGALDWANYKYNPTLHNSLNDLDRSPSRLKTYYWQMYMETPVLNRYLSGFYLYYSGLDGIFPYAYRHQFENDQPYVNDLRPKDKKSRLRKYNYVTYPSNEGPVPTLQWEAFVEGDNDLRYCYLLEEMISLLKLRGEESLARGIENDFKDRLRQVCQFYPANRVKAYQKYEMKLSRALEGLREWILNVWQKHSDSMSVRQGQQ